MKMHLCFLNYSKWSSAVNGYDGQIQVRVCTICGSIHYRNIGYASQVKANELNNAAKEVLSS